MVFSAEQLRILDTPQVINPSPTEIPPVKLRLPFPIYEKALIRPP